MSSKRKALNSPDYASTPEPQSKRSRKQNNDTYFPEVETVATTKDLGHKILGLLKRAKDKNERLIATDFIDLPDRKLYPDYYEQIALPMSVTLIEKKLDRGEYATMSDVESDLKRMVQNAKDYNTSGSPVFEDAERIRKALSNFMPKHNPAYQDPNYRAVPTPIPDHLNRREASASASDHSAPIKLKISTGARGRSTARSEPPDTSTPDDVTLKAMEDLLDQLSVQEDAINFEVKPSRRDYGDYYRIIKQPTAIRDVRKRVQEGNVKTWEDFARETRLIWTNAKEYNEPTSVIYTMTERLETWMEDRLKGHGVAPKVETKLSLKVAPPPQLKLKFGSNAPATPSPVVNGNPNGYTVDHSALERQKSEMAAALNRARDGPVTTSTPAPAVPSSLRRSVSVIDQDIPMTGTNDDHKVPAPSATPSLPPPSGPTHLPTPALEVEETKPPSRAPAPALTNGYHIQPQIQQAPTTIFAESTNPIDRKWRDPDKTAADALLQSVTYMTNPHTPSDPRWRLTRHAHPSKTQTSYYTYLPYTHQSIRIVPELHSELKQGRRRFKLFVLNNNAVIPASPDVAGQGVYDLQLVPGENLVTVEAISSLREGERKDYAKEWEQFDFEKVTFYIYLRPKVL